MIRKKIAFWLLRLANKLNPQSSGNKSVVTTIQVVGELLKNKTVLITGAAGQVGGSIAEEIAAQGANLILLDSKPDSGNKLLLKLGQQVLAFIVCDVSKNRQIDGLCDRLAHLIAPDGKAVNVDILIHAAGIQHERSAGDPMEPHQWDETFASNVIGPAYLTERLLKYQSTKNPKIQAAIGLQSVLFISSIHQTEVVGWPSYSSSKAALGMLIKELAVELGPKGVRVNSIAPGWVALDEHQQPRRSRYSLLRQQSVSPQSIARAAVFLSSETCSPQTSGASLTIDSAMSLFNHRVDIEYEI
ncbi:MAG: NAD(P)-dependent dehydrogenase (short-subunit alcohol dehydrogenase family) [Arenicella sp.]|jgi:NAD(P)-dependent dehydrogenase (short-subunit alcohol dehydrogenase family)